MGLFEKKYCSLCGGKAGNFLDREKLAGDGQYLCEDCQARCSRELLREGISDLTIDQIRAHIAYLEKCERIYNDEFEETTCYTGEDEEDYDEEDDEEDDEDYALVSVDEEHGWWVDANTEDYSIYRLDGISRVEVRVDTRLPDDNEFSNVPRRKVMREIEDELEDDMPDVPQGERVEAVYVEVFLKNDPWVKTVRIYLLNEEYADPDDIEEALLNAGGLANYLRDLAGGESVSIEEHA